MEIFAIKALLFHRMMIFDLSLLKKYFDNNSDTTHMSLINTI